MRSSRGPRTRGFEWPDQEGCRAKKRLRGERLTWYRIASHLHIPVEELRNRITHSEFLEWVDFLNWEFTEHHSKIEYYLAQIAVVIGAANGTKGLKINDFLLRLGTEEPKEELSKEERIKKSMSAWSAFLGGKNN